MEIMRAPRLRASPRHGGEDYPFAYLKVIEAAVVAPRYRNRLSYLGNQKYY